VDKPPGVLTVPGRGEDPSTSLWRSLESERGERLWVVHRLDRETSGVLVLARTPEAHRQGSIAFEQGRVEKEYLAFTQGVPRASVIQEPLVVGERGRVSVAQPGQKGAKSALTRVSIVRRWPEHAVAMVKCLPATGRQHQIRVHLAHAGAPILCDPLYGERRGSDRDSPTKEGSRSDPRSEQTHERRGSDRDSPTKEGSLAGRPASPEPRSEQTHERRGSDRDSPTKEGSLAGRPASPEPWSEQEHDRTTSWPISRVALHAARLVVPASWGGHELTAPLPPDFVATLRALDGVE
jgi:hypothetical protein